MEHSYRGRTTPAMLAAVVLLLAGVALLVDRPARSAASAPVLLAAGDIDGCGAGAGTAQIVGGIDGTVAVLGDNAYPGGSPSDYSQCYDKTWGRFKDRTHPVPGNHDYDTSGAPGYFRYFGSAAGPAGKGYYSYDVAGWHVVAINSNCDSIDCDAEGAWLDGDLSAHPAPCILAYWHHPRFSSGSAGDNPSMNTFWKVLYNHGASVVLNGHDHDYERFAPQDPGGHLDQARGIRQFIVGTGGGPLGSLYGASPNSEVRNNRTFGVLQLSLRPDGYDWRFIPVSDKGFTDSGSDTCRGTAASTSTTPPAAAAPDAPEPAPAPGPSATPAPPAADPGPSSYIDRSGESVPPVTAAAPTTTTGLARPGAPRSGPATSVTQPASSAPRSVTSTSGSTAPAAPPPPTVPHSAAVTGMTVPGPDGSLVAAISQLGRVAPASGRSPGRSPLTLVAVTALLLDCALLAACGRGSRNAGSRPGSGWRPGAAPGSGRGGG